jgi:hypothetical protein
VDECLEDSHERLLVGTQKTHGVLTSCSVAAFDVANFHGKREHSCETEWHSLRVLLAMHCDFETVTEVNVHNFTGDAVKHEVGGMSVAQTEDIANHGHDRKGACVVGTPVEPGFRALALEPKNAVQVLACGVVQSVAEHFNLLHKREIIIVGCHLQHDPVLDVEQNFAALAVFADEDMKSVAVRNPTEQTG